MLEFHGETDVGRRRQLNEDAIFAGDGLFIVCDGMGGHKAGEVASKLATDAIANFVKRSAEDPELTWPYGFDPTLSYDGNRLDHRDQARQPDRLPEGDVLRRLQRHGHHRGGVALLAPAAAR